MGLTIHYTIRLTPRRHVLAAEFVETVRRQIVRRRLGQVSPLHDAGKGPAGGSQFVCVNRKADQWAEIDPWSGALFTLEVGKGCEPAVMGLCCYPPAYRLQPVPQLRGWNFSGFAKTQYASLHGWEHFRRCHLAVLTALEIWRELGASVKINDEGGYWPRRSERTLRRELDEMNGIVAGMAGAMRDATEEAGGKRGAIQSPVFGHPQFERLEAEGVARHGGKFATAVAAVRR